MAIQTAVAKPWMKAILLTAFITTSVSGIIAIFFPSFIFKTYQLSIPNHLFIWEELGVVQVLFGLGYLISFFNPYRNWVPVLMGLLFNIFSACLFFWNLTFVPDLATLTGYILVAHIIWIIPFSLVLFKTYERTLTADTLLIDMIKGHDFSLDMFETNYGEKLLDLTRNEPVMLVFLRHFGCSFCKETLSDIAQHRKSIESMGTRIVLVHMLEDDEETLLELEKYGLSDMPYISDPETILYKKFALRKGSIPQLFGFKVLFRGVWAGFSKGLWVSREKGDAFQMPGLFLLFNGKIIKSYIHRSAADRPKYLTFARCEPCEVR